MDGIKAEIMDGQVMARSVTRISCEIVERNRGAENLLLVGIRRRGAVLARRISARLEETEGKNVPVIELDVTRFRDDRQRERGAAPPDLGGFDLSLKTVVIIDDVLHTGRTARAAMEAVLLAGRAGLIQLAVLVDRGHRELPIRPDYVGKNLPTSKEEKVRVLVYEYDGREGVVITKKGGGGDADGK